MKLQSLVIIYFAIGFASCSSQKAITSQVSTNSTSQKKRDTKELISFFDAENAKVLGNNKLALQLYTEMAKQYPQNATVHYNLAGLQLQKMDLKAAEKNAERAYTLDTDNRYFQDLYIQILVLNKKTKKAELQYEDLVKKYPYENEYLYNKGILHMMMKDYDKALNTFSQLENRMGFDEDIIRLKQNIYLRQGQTELAVDEIKKLKRSDLGSPKYDIMMADIYESAKQKEKVIELYKGIEQNYATDPMAQVALAQYYLDQNNKKQYNHFMQLVMKNKNLDVDTKIALIIPTLKKLETDSVEKDEMIELAHSISTESPNNKDALSLYADVLYFSGKFDLALDEYKKYLALDTNKYQIWSQLISIYSDKQQFDSVISLSERCIKIFPKNAVPYFYAGVASLQKKETEKAIIWLKNGLAQGDDKNVVLQAQFYASLGDAYNTLKNYKLSDSCFEEAIKLQPAESTTLNNYAYYLSVRKERLDDAERMSKKSLELQPSSKSFLDTYGWILFQKGNYKEALVYIQKAIQANGQDDGTLFEHLGDVYYKLNEADRAKENWKVAKEKGENNPVLLKKIKEGTFYE